LALLMLLKVSGEIIENPMPSGFVPYPQPSMGPQMQNTTTDPLAYIYEKVELALQIALIVVGSFWVLIGFRFMVRIRLTLLLAGFIIFYFLTFQLLKRFTVADHLLEMWLAYVLAAVAGLIGGSMFLLSKIIGKFLFSVLLGILFTTLLFAYTPLGSIEALEYYIKLSIIGGVGVILGFFSLYFFKFVPIVGTSFNGAFLIGNGIDSLLIHSGASDLLEKIIQTSGVTPYTPFQISRWQVYAVLGGIIVVTLLGIIIQYKITAAKVSDSGNDNDSEKLHLLGASSLNTDY